MYNRSFKGQYCDYCDPNNEDKIHHANYSIDGTDKWWQSPPLSRSLDFNQVNLTIDFGQVLNFVLLIYWAKINLMENKGALGSLEYI
jgi:laminin alpha 3/5